MKEFYKKPLLLVVFLLAGMMSCDKATEMKTILEFIPYDSYYSEEVIPSKYGHIYGEWALYKISGGISGAGYNPDFDYLLIKNIGIYGIVKDGNLMEYGKIEVETFDENGREMLQIELIPENITGESPYMMPNKYVSFNGRDSLDLRDPCCDLYDYHFKRVR